MRIKAEGWENEHVVKIIMWLCDKDHNRSLRVVGSKYCETWSCRQCNYLTDFLFIFNEHIFGQWLLNNTCCLFAKRSPFLRSTVYHNIKIILSPNEKNIIKE